MNDIVLHLIYNASLLLALGIVCEASYLLPKKWGQANKVIGGLMIGFIGILVMTLPFTLSEGITFDTRSILISVSAMIFGPVQAIIAAVMTILYRIIFIGGAGTLTGSSVIAVSAVLGLLALGAEKEAKTPLAVGLPVWRYRAHCDAGLHDIYAGSGHGA